MQKETSQLHNYVYSSEMVDLVTISNEFCLYLEQLNGEEGKAFIGHSVKHLSALYAGFLKVGETEPVLETGGEPTVTEQVWSGVYQKIAQILGPYNDILRPAEEDEFDRSELVIHTVSEDLADLYQDLRDFTALYSTGLEEVMHDAAWELSVRFAEHWGHKLLRSLSALHVLYVNGTDPTSAL